MTASPAVKAASQVREAAAMQKIHALPKKPPQLIETRMALAEYKRQQWVVTPEVGVGIEMLMDPVYWAHVANKLTRGARIEAVPEDMSYFAELFVVSVDKTAAKMVLLRHVPLRHGDLAGEEDLAAYDITFAGAVAKWRGIRKADGQVLVSGLDTRDAVAEWLRNENNLKTTQ